MTRLLMLAGFLMAAVPSPAHAWGSEAHHHIMDRAIDLLPVEIKPLFERFRAMVVERVIDPDTWRTAGFETEDPNHFLDLDVPEYGPYPFAALPRDFDQAVQTFGLVRVRTNGLVPWRTAEMWGNLRRAFEAYPQRPFARTDILNFAAWMAHYASDAHQPLHGVANYNGQLSGQVGVHARFETTLFERYRAQLRTSARSTGPVRNPRDFIFDAILEDTRLVPVILAADKAAIADRDVYDDAYFDAFFRAVQPLMERRLDDSISAVAALIAGAWEAAGRPPVPVEPVLPPERRRR